MFSFGPYSRSITLIDIKQSRSLMDSFSFIGTIFNSLYLWCNERNVFPFFS